MNRVAGIIVAGEWNDASAIDRVTLDADDRQRRRFVFRSESGAEFLLDLAKPIALHDGDGLVLEGGDVVRICGAPESLIEITAPSRLAFVRLAWHLGNRHTDVQIAGDKLRIRGDHVLEEMVKGLGCSVAHVEAPFDPEANVHADGHEHDHGA
jgi:urease accessory protein